MFIYAPNLHIQGCPKEDIDEWFNSADDRVCLGHFHDLHGIHLKVKSIKVSWEGLSTSKAQAICARDSQYNFEIHPIL